MKYGFRKPSFKKSVSARTTGRVKRAAKKAVNPLYGTKGTGFIKNPKKAAYNKVYNKTTFGLSDILNWFIPKDQQNEVATTSLDDYERESRAFDEYREKYGHVWNLYGDYREKITHYYSEYINTKEKRYFTKLYSYCMKYIDLLPKIKEAKEAEAKITGEPVTNDTYCIAYHKLAMAYEKAGDYDNAIKVCEEAISKGFTDKTKGGYEARINRIKKKQSKQV